MKNPQNRLDEKAIDLFKKRGLMVFLFYLSLSVGTFFIFTHYDWDMLLYSLIPVTAIPFGLYYLLIVPERTCHIFRYEVQDNKIQLKSGVIIISQTVIPMFRVQHVQTTQGPLMKRFGLSKLLVYTAGSVYQIPALSEGIAEELRERIATLTEGME